LQTRDGVTGSLCHTLQKEERFHCTSSQAAAAAAPMHDL